MGTGAYADWGKVDEAPEEVVETNKPSDEFSGEPVPEVKPLEENEIPE